MTDTIDIISSIPDKSEVRSWERKCVAMSRLIAELEPLSDQILALMKERQPLIDQVEELRHQMTQECIHAKEHLVQYDDHVHCRFCERKLVLPQRTE